DGALLFPPDLSPTDESSAEVSAARGWFWMAAACGPTPCAGTAAEQESKTASPNITERKNRVIK
ncbi:MAG TPA: hypothetical protein VG501_09515, partial [Rhizomicrobium sp.]|nr:hypothetical protein [Rhizomicrobium sp.]